MQPAALQAAAAEAPGLEQVQQQVAEWLKFDKDAASRAKVQDLLSKQAYIELKELMCQRLEFGELPASCLAESAPPNIPAVQHIYSMLASAGVVQQAQTHKGWSRTNRW
jgi:hypothetical protein